MGKARPKPIGNPFAGRSRRLSIAKLSVQNPLRATKRRLVGREPDWIAWNSDGSRMLARSATLEGAREAARKMGELEPILEPAQILGRIV